MNRSFIPLLSLLISLQSQPAWAQDEGFDDGISYFLDKQRGWLWYEVIPEPVRGSSA